MRFVYLKKLLKKDNIFLSFVVIAVMLIHPELTRLQRYLDDYIQKQKNTQQMTHPVKIVYFDDEAIKQLKGWPLSRNIYAYLIHILNNLETAVIGIDVFFPQHKTYLDENDQLLIQINNLHKNIINCFYYEIAEIDTNLHPLNIESLKIQVQNNNIPSIKKLNLPISRILEVNPKAGFSNVNIDDNGFIRSLPLVIKYNQTNYPSFSLRIAMEYLKTRDPSIEPSEVLDVLKHTWKKEYFINYLANPEKIDYIPALKLIKTFNTKDTTSFNVSQFRDSIVLISVMSENLGSCKTTPVDPHYPMSAIHAQVIDNILGNTFLKYSPGYITILNLFFLLLLYILLSRYRLFYSILYLLSTALLYTGLYLVFFQSYIILPVLSIYITLLVMSIHLSYIYYQKQILTEKTRYRSLETELHSKVLKLSELENELQNVRNSESKLLHEKINTYRKEIKRLQHQIKDLVHTELIEENETHLQKIFPDIVFSETSPLRKILQNVQKVAPTNSTIMILGESGTGKELIAKAIHQMSDRKKFPFVAVNCAALTETLIESELFGHEKGAFTGATNMRKGFFETAHNGTIFLDEITETSLPFQAKLLRVIQEKEFYRVGSERPIKSNIRIIAASNRDLNMQVTNKQFRQDLYYRLNVISLEIPPLRDRTMDIPVLVNHFLKSETKQFSQAALDTLKQYPWPGNIRELQNVIHRCTIMCDASTISANWLKSQFNDISQQPGTPDELAQSIIEKLRVKNFKFSCISEIADELGYYHRSTVTEHLKGFIFQTFYEQGYSLERTIRQINPNQDKTGDQKIHKRIQSYLKNLRKSINTAQSYEENLHLLKSRFKNLPQRYHFYLEEIIKGYLNGDWAVQ